MVTNPPKVYVLCGKGSCEGWARAQGLTFYSIGTVAGVRGPRRPPRRQKAQCARCLGPLTHVFRHDGKRFCTLTCQDEYRADSGT